MTNLDKLNSLFDNYMLERKKQFITLRKGRELIKNSDDLDIRNLDLKKLLESGLIKNSIQTLESPKQWRIFMSSEDLVTILPAYLESKSTEDISFKNPLKYDLKNNTFTDERISTDQKQYGKIVLISTVVILLFIYLLMDSDSIIENKSNNKSYVSENNSTSLVKDDNLELLHRFTSTSNDYENMSGVISKTNNEITYHVFDFKNKRVACARLVGGKLKTSDYEMKSFYKEEGLVASTYVIKIKSNIVKEIWFSPEADNIGYDYFNGTRNSFYGLSRTR